MTGNQSRLPALKPEFVRSGTKSKSKRQNSSSVLSIRISHSERAELERRSAGQNLSTYVRSSLFDSDATKPIRTTEYKQAVAQAMGKLGKSAHIGTLQRVLRACDDGALILHEDAEIALRRACTQIDDMRRELLSALGLRPR